MTQTITIGKRLVGPQEPVFIIAEIGMNHNGDLELAKRMVRAAAKCGADAVKFQTFKTELLYARDFPDFEQRRKMELPYEWHHPLMSLSNDAGMEFISTPFDLDSAAFLDELGVPCFKVASCDLNNYPFLRRLAKKGKPLLVSTGFSTLAEIDQAVATVRQTGNDELVLLHCVASYPAPAADCNLRAIQTLRQAFGTVVGLSDHTADPSVAPIAATALGACVLEKHFTVDCELPGYDHLMSQDPAGMRLLVEQVRSATAALGSGLKSPTATERDRVRGARRSLYWKQSYAAGTCVDDDMLVTLRPAAGLAPEALDTIRGRRLSGPVEAGALLDIRQIDWNKA